ncbi:unnamed protein product [Rotaria sordida]|uniref:Uncharacterized protein n=1 Tax=Rotaria sordida TaxID=392033 RepID=A0A814U3I4_9BILA|nr:unnamed protein product [Rotaria sordida]CAF1169617.1 unnamed protein product [Rotaria sordida]CAF1175056.1 unnamed protein product [Rotaria sordida]
MVDINRRSPVTCTCGKTVQQRNLAQHCSSKSHTAFAAKHLPIAKDEKDDVEKTGSSDLLFDLTAFLREHDLRTDHGRIQAIVDRRLNMDPYTKVKLSMENGEPILNHYDIDHIHEAQILACAIRHTPELAPRVSNTLVLQPLRSVLNDVSNLAITEAKVNRSKGQAVKYFLGHFQTSTELPLLSAFIQTADGKERSIAHFARNIVDTIQATSSDMSDSIRQTRMENGYVTGANSYETVAEQFDTIIDRMQLNWNEGVKLRNGKTYYVST